MQKQILFTLLTLTLIMLAEAANAQYMVPITITERSGKNLYNYTIKIVLNSTFEGWKYVSGTGSDIYFTDTDGKPLYYWIEYFNKTEKKAIIWVKIPYIPANGQTTIYMYFGGINPYTTYNNPNKVFIFYDDFASDTSSKYTLTGAHVAGTTPTFSISDGIARLSLPIKGHGLAVAGVTVTTNFAIEAKIRDPDTTDNSQVGIAIHGATEDVIFRIIDHDSRHLFIDELHVFYANGEEIDIWDKATTTDTSWHILMMGYYNNTFYLYKDGKLEATVTYTLTDNTLSPAFFVGWDSGTVVEFDYIIVRPFVYPEPTLKIGPIILVAFRGIRYRVPITITEQSGNNLYNYTIKIVLNSTNFSGWSYTSKDGNDIYFTDSIGNPLYYWIEYFNKTEEKAVIWVRVPEIPANSQVTIFMWFGGFNMYRDYNNASKVFIYFNGGSVLDFDEYPYDIVSKTNPSGNVDGYDPSGWAVQNNVIVHRVTVDTAHMHAIKHINLSNYCIHADVNLDALEEIEEVGIVFRYDNGDAYILRLIYNLRDNGRNGVEFIVKTNGDTLLGVNYFGLNANTWYSLELCGYGSTIIAYVNGKEMFEVQDTTLSSGYFGLHSAYSYGVAHSYKNIYVRPFVYPEPDVSIGSIEIVPGRITLPSESVYLVHDIVYSPNATQFTHTFTATNETEAGFELGVPDAWGWRLYANPYNNVNTATLVSVINITLPYDAVFIKNLTLYARANATGSYRQLWIEILDSNGNVIAELNNATIGTSWTKVVIPVETRASGQITIWINATIVTTTTSSEEIDVKDVKLYVEYNTSILISPVIYLNAEFFDCIGQHYVLLGSEAYVNNSVILIKVNEHLTFNYTEYPVEPLYIGNETINDYTYMVYKIEPAIYSQNLIIHALVKNALTELRIHVKGIDTATALVNEPLTIELPTLANVTIPSLDWQFTNVTKVTIRFTTPGIYTIIASVFQPRAWLIGYTVKEIIIKYGRFNVKLLDLDAKPLSYENLSLQLINESIGNIVVELVGNTIFNLTNLPAGNYTVRLVFKDVVVAATHFELNITTDNTTITLPCSMRMLPSDYRGLNKTIIYEFDKQLVAVKNLSNEFPYSRLTILLNGTGPFKLYIDYRGDLPTAVKVEGNVTGLHYYWLGNYLVVTGVLGSVGEINITDLYRVRVEIYDRLGNYMPSWVYAYINGTKYGGAVIEDYLYPGDYVLTLPASVNGFEFYGFWDGFNETRRNFTVVDSDVNFRVWYRVPTRIEVKPVVVENGTDYVTVYFEGRVVDYYGGGVPNRNVTLIIENKDTGARMMANLTLDADGRFVSPTIELLPGTYTIKVVYNGDDVYVGSSTETTATFTVKTPTPTPVPGPSIEYVLAGVGVLAVLAALASLARIGRRTRFVKASHA